MSRLHLYQAPCRLLRQALLPALVTGSYKTCLNSCYAIDGEGWAVVHLYGRKQTSRLLWLPGAGLLWASSASQTGTTVSSSGTRTVAVSPLS